MITTSETYTHKRAVLEMVLVLLLFLFGLWVETVNHDLIESVIYAIIFAIVPAPILFAAYYTRSPWRASQIGRALMTFAVTFSVFMLFVSISVFFGDWNGKDALRLVIYGGVGKALWGLFFTLRRSQRQASLRQRTAAADRTVTTLPREDFGEKR